MEIKSNKDKLYSILMDENVVDEIRNNINFLISIMPEIKDMIGFEHNHPHHHLDVWEHTLKALYFAKPVYEIRLALLLHDIGKPHRVQFDGKVNHYKGHNRASCDIANRVMKDLMYDEETTNIVCEIVLRHDTPIHKCDIEKNPDFCKLLFEVQRCDAYAHNPEFNEKRIKYITEVEKLFDN
jgi:tRNA nucleotidyltransferase (CCA-adding enzyme)